MTLLPVRKFRIVENRKETEQTFTLVLEPADGEPMFSFEAGQFVMVHLMNGDGSHWAKAAYSMATAPTESKTSFEMGIKVNGDFTKRASTLTAGDEVGIQGPYGMFTLKTDADPLVFFAGGIGMTPLRGMIRELLLTNASNQIILFYSDRTRGDLAYEDELRQLVAEHPNFKPVFILTRETPAGWDGETARLSLTLVKKYLADFQNARYFMCGPKEFMESVKAMLEAEGVDIKTKLQKELF